jgi:hypothetical protein
MGIFIKHERIYMKKQNTVINRLDVIRYILDKETDRNFDVSQNLDYVVKQLENYDLQETSIIKIASGSLDNGSDNLIEAFQMVKELIAELSEIEANKDLPPPEKKKAH